MTRGAYLDRIVRKGLSDKTYQDITVSQMILTWFMRYSCNQCHLRWYLKNTKETAGEELKKAFQAKTSQHLWKAQGAKLFNKFRNLIGQWGVRKVTSEGTGESDRDQIIQGFWDTEKSLGFTLSILERSLNREVPW